MIGLMRMIVFLLFLLPAATAARADCVVLLHGLSRSDTSMLVVQEVLQYHGYRVVNYHYPSNDAPIPALVTHVGRAVDQCGTERTHFVTHSLGGILLRAWLAENRPPLMGRAVMLAPPNGGTEIIDTLRRLELGPEFLELVFGPAASELGTDLASIPGRLPPVDFELGVIAGSVSLNPLAPLALDGAHDGTVTVASTRVDGMSDHIVVAASHSLIMNNPIVLAEVLEFLRYGVFDHGITFGNALRKLVNP